MNILFKNTMVISIGIITYAICGFNLMYLGTFNGFVGFAGAGLESYDSADHSVVAGGYAYFTTSCSRHVRRYRRHHHLWLRG